MYLCQVDILLFQQSVKVKVRNNNHEYYGIETNINNIKNTIKSDLIHENTVTVLWRLLNRGLIKGSDWIRLVFA